MKNFASLIAGCLLSGSILAQFPTSDLPEVLWSEVMGGVDQDNVNAISTDDDGNIYLACNLSSSNSLLMIQAQNAHNGGLHDAAVVKLSVTGDFVWATYLGGLGTDEAADIHLLPSGNILVAGTSSSPLGFAGITPLEEYHGGASDGFIAELNPSGEILRYTFLGGNGADVIHGLASAPDGSVTLVGATSTALFTGDVVPAATFAGGESDGWIVLLNDDFELEKQELYGSAGTDVLNDIVAVSPVQHAICGAIGANAEILSLSPVSFGGSIDGLLAVTNSNLGLEWAVYSGGSGIENYTSVAKGSDFISVAGRTTSPSLFSTSTVSTNGPSDALLLTFSTDGAYLWGHSIGGSEDEQAHSVSVDFMDHVYVSGDTFSADFPTEDGFITEYKGLGDAFISRWNASGQLVLSSLLGDNKADNAKAGIVDRFGKWIIAGQTASTPFPYSNSEFMSSGEIWTARISLCNNPVMNIHALDSTTFCDGGIVAFCGSGAVHKTWANGDTLSFTSAEDPIDMFLIGTNDNACYGKSQTIPVIELERPDVAIIPLGSTFFCEEEQIDLWVLAESSNAIAFDWSNDMEGDSIHITAMDTLRVIATGPNGCKQSSDPLIIELPDAMEPIMTIASEFACPAGDPVQMLALPVGGFYNGVGVLNDYFHPEMAGPGYHEITYSYIDNESGCILTSDPVYVEVSFGMAEIITPATEICLIDEPVELIGIPENGVFTGEGMEGSTFFPDLSGTGSFDITYEVNDEFGCLSQATVTIVVDECIPNSVETNEKAITRVYPNPASHFTYFEIENNTLGTIQIFNAAGQIAKQITHQGTRTQVDISDLADGVYHICLNNEQGLVSSDNLLIVR